MKELQALLPAREAMEVYGWTHQVQWTSGGNTCFVRCTSGKAADKFADDLRKQGEKPVVFDLRDLMQIH